MSARTVILSQTGTELARRGEVGAPNSQHGLWEIAVLLPYFCQRGRKGGDPLNVRPQNASGQGHGSPGPPSCWAGDLKKWRFAGSKRPAGLKPENDHAGT